MATGIIFFHAAAGITLGYAVLHPGSMVINVLTGESGHPLSHAFVHSFSNAHLGMAACYAALGGIIGVAYALYAQAVRRRYDLAGAFDHSLPVCAWCKKTRPPGADPDTPENWRPFDSYVEEKTGVHLSHVICPECSEKLYPRGRRVSCRYGFGVDCAGVEDVPETGRGLPSRPHLASRRD